MTTAHDTQRMIHMLAAQAGHRQSTPSYGASLAAGVVLSLLCAVTLTLLLLGVPQAGLESVLTQGAFQFKAAAMLSLAFGGIVLARFAGRPGSSALACAALLPGAAMLVSGAATDASGLPLLGASSISMPHCLAGIVVLSLPGLAIILAAMRRGVPTRPALAGAAAGMLAGALAAAAYAMVCKNDGALFVAVWYPAAMAAVTGLGAMIGPKALAW